MNIQQHNTLFDLPYSFHPISHLQLGFRLGHSMQFLTNMRKVLSCLMWEIKIKRIDFFGIFDELISTFASDSALHPNPMKFYALSRDFISTMNDSLSPVMIFSIIFISLIFSYLLLVLMNYSLSRFIDFSTSFILGPSII